ncbi:MAG: aminotransferase class III-fold pyridoxal phosphate-dependent enzyme [Candidatus Helarchaeota archaeon]|nr:aminotransferase class III-fold pyridoxal phosphate-dependent enzyme [Candidatus Helarchaeota archaeon]
MEYEEIIRRLRDLVTQPVRRIAPENMKRAIGAYEDLTPRSKELFDKAKTLIPGGLEHNLSIKHPYPIVIDKALGPYMWDVDGNQYIDFLSCGGPIILGHNYAPIRDAVADVVQNNQAAHGVTSEYEIKAIEQIKKYVPSVELFRFFASGTEADMATLRVARVFTGKKKIIKIGGSYHGWGDQLVYDMHIPGIKAIESHGIPNSVLKHTVSIPPNNEKKLKRVFKKYENDVAAIIVEPLGGESGTHPIKPGWNQTLREICDEHGALLIFDEVVSGFRMAMGGAQEYYNVTPDLTAFGKIITHGFPMCGGVGGREDVMIHFAAGIEGVEKGKKRTYTGGTVTANPITCAACYHTIKAIAETNAIEKAAAAGDRLTKGLEELFEKYNLPFVAFNFKSVLHIETGAPLALRLSDPDIFTQINVRKKVMDEFQAALLTEGVFTLAGSRGYTTMAHTNEIIDQALEAYDRVLQLVE